MTKGAVYVDLTNEHEEFEQETAEDRRMRAYYEEEVSLFSTPLGAWAMNTVGHKAIRDVVLPVVYKLMEELETTKAAKDLNENNSQEEAEKLQKEIDERDTEIAKLRAEKYEAEQIAEDRAAKLSNCYNELSEAKETIEELNTKLKEATAPKTPARTNLDGGEEMKKEKRAIYDVKYFGYNDNKYTAKFADTDETFEDWSLYKDVKYQEVSAEQASTFRTVQSVEDDQRDSEVEEQSLEVVVPSAEEELESTFREEDEEETAGSELVTEPSSVVGSFITEERILSIENRVANIERLLNPPAGR